MAGISIHDYPHRAVFVAAHSALKGCLLKYNKLHLASGNRAIQPYEIKEIQDLQVIAYNAIEAAKSFLVLKLASTNEEFQLKAISGMMELLDCRYNHLFKMTVGCKSLFQSRRAEAAAVQREAIKIQSVESLVFFNHGIIWDLHGLWNAEWKPQAAGGQQNNPKFLLGLKAIIGKILPLEDRFSGASLKHIHSHQSYGPLLRMYRLYLHIDRMRIPEQAIFFSQDYCLLNIDRLRDFLLVGPNRPIAMLSLGDFNEEMSDEGRCVKFFDIVKQRGLKEYSGEGVTYLCDEAAFNNWYQSHTALLVANGWATPNPQKFLDHLPFHPPQKETPLFDAISEVFGNYGTPGCKSINFLKFFAVSK